MKEKIQAIYSVAEQLNAKVVSDYSGRGMFGRTCYGVIHKSSTEVIEEAASYGLRNAKTDNMGKSYIVYWPHISDE